MIKSFSPLLDKLTTDEMQTEKDKTTACLASTNLSHEPPASHLPVMKRQPSKNSLMNKQIEAKKLNRLKRNRQKRNQKWANFSTSQRDLIFDKLQDAFQNLDLEIESDHEKIIKASKIFFNLDYSVDITYKSDDLEEYLVTEATTNLGNTNLEQSLMDENSKDSRSTNDTFSSHKTSAPQSHSDLNSRDLDRGRENSKDFDQTFTEYDFETCQNEISKLDELEDNMNDSSCLGFNLYNLKGNEILELCKIFEVAYN